MRDQLRLLAALQELDSRLRVLAIEKQSLPQQLRSYEQTCQDVREQLTSTQSEMVEAEHQRRVLEREIDTSNDRLAKTQNRLHEVKTNKEYRAVVAEIDAGRERIRTLEDRVLELMEGAERQHEISQRYAQHLQEAARELAEQERKVSETQDILNGDMATHDHERDELITLIQPDFYTAYQRAARQAGGVAVVELMAGETCGGCYLRIRPQLVSEIKKQESLVSCPHCKRLLLWPV